MTGIEKLNATQPLRNIKSKIYNLKKLLSDSDYKAIKYAEGLISEEDYQQTKSERQSYRNQINELEDEYLSSKEDLISRGIITEVLN